MAARTRNRPGSSTEPTTSAGPGLISLLAPSVFLAVGAALWAMALLTLRFADLFIHPLTHGALRSMALICLVVGWLVPSMAAAASHVLPRLTGGTLAFRWAAAATTPIAAALALGGVALTLAGFSDGSGALGLPVWFDLAIIGLAMIPAAVALGTIRNSGAGNTFVSLWFIAGGAAWLPVLLAVTTIPGSSSLAQAIQETVFLSGFNGLWIAPMGIGLAYYTVVKASGGALANRPLAKVGFWTLVVAAAWSGPVRLAFAPYPDWLMPMSTILGLAFPASLMANAAVMALTAKDGWDAVRSSPALLATAIGMVLGMLAASMQALAGFRTAAATVAFTSFWDGIDTLWMFGFGGLVLAGFAHQAISDVAAKRSSPVWGIRSIRMLAVGSVTTSAALMLAGVLTGFEWNAASLTLGSFREAGATWAEASSASRPLLTVAAVASIFLVIGAVLTVANLWVDGRRSRPAPEGGVE